MTLWVWYRAYSDFLLTFFCYDSWSICLMGTYPSHTCRFWSNVAISRKPNQDLHTTLYSRVVSCSRKHYVSFWWTVCSATVTSYCLWDIISYLSDGTSTKKSSSLSKCPSVSCGHHEDGPFSNITKTSRFCIYWWNESTVCRLSPVNTSILSLRNVHYYRWRSLLCRQDGRILALPHWRTVDVGDNWFGWWRWCSKDYSLRYILRYLKSLHHHNLSFKFIALDCIFCFLVGT